MSLYLQWYCPSYHVRRYKNMYRYYVIHIRKGLHMSMPDFDDQEYISPYPEVWLRGSHPFYTRRTHCPMNRWKAARFFV